ncbi:23S rRNA (adenine(2030)-N(6))-methyltransferase RlmJ [Mangrovibrevibacter kandeliae]|uniref:23S rRNA (adenine(2030)-N(6))-methyltransferase RlmJ n=1 Tax=Mangrovibrevibacter kandeliae TaxID=2968473 RepID=UPI002119B35F|nr:23S rRNA (adenine(2030)-N(6))-methyltransferase RlmJ [Aurantimonas sp. CSK15Z-1]MCQ8781398.1 23S rRNA (adenine(2030)-N(6))-methyltransferase RlmJ [Aurantimonas sp. CSK15Z-1]
MNYRHAFHAGNFADVVKHALLTRLIEYLKTKDKPFRVFDTHAGRGLYDLTAEEAGRTGEHRAGIGALLASPAAADPLLQPYLDVVRSLGNDRYPGSPLLARRLLRPQDRLSAYELHPVDAGALAAVFAGDHQVKAIELDGWLALGAHLPPKERRGLVLVDPPFEQPGEYDRLVDGLVGAQRRWAGGVYALWYPIKRAAEHRRFLDRLSSSGIAKIVVAEFLREAPSADERLVGSGLVVVNPPYTFAAEAEATMSRLSPVLAKAGGATSRVVALAGEQS